MSSFSPSDPTDPVSVPTVTATATLTSPLPLDQSQIQSQGQSHLQPSASNKTIPPFPHPALFTTLPDLYAVISRLSLLTKSPLLLSSSDQPIALTKTNSKEPPIEIKDLPSLLYGVRQQISDARDAVSSLPDVEREIEEQEVEIKELERRIKGLKGRVGELGALAAGTTGDVMEGVEGG